MKCGLDDFTFSRDGTAVNIIIENIEYILRSMTLAFKKFGSPNYYGFNPFDIYL